MPEGTIKHIVVVDNRHGGTPEKGRSADKGKNGIPEHPDRLILSATDFIANEGAVDLRRMPKLKVINLCNNYDYLSKGYYVSLLAEARGMRCVPSVSDIVTLTWKRNYQASLPELEGLLEKHFNEPPDEPLRRTYTVYFGRVEHPKLEPVARRMFDMFRFPLMTLELAYGLNGKWEIEAVAPLAPGGIPREKNDVFYGALDKFTGAAWRNSDAGKKAERYWIAILHDPEEEMAPSGKAALKKFAKVGKEMGLFIEFITRADYASLLEYDALFIRETTAINHHTFRFAHKAGREDIPCIDDTQSIIRCCNKVFQHELLEANGVPVPRTIVLDRRSDRLPDTGISFPAVIKIPDGSFSRGVMKVSDEKEFRAATNELLKSSEIVLCQEFVPSDFDWRIGILNGEPLFACKYFMAKGHWQIYNHAAKTRKAKEGADQAYRVEDVPKDVMKVALKAAKLIGNGLYGVDLKQTNDGKVVVMEVNDNPNIDHGVEDRILGDELYRRVLAHLVTMIQE